VREKFERIVPRELQRVQTVIEDMMELARPTVLQLEPLDLNELLGELIELFEAQMAGQKIAVCREFDPTLPPLMGDRKRLHRCFGNFTTNAIQAMPSGGELRLQTARVPAMLFPDSATSSDGPKPAIQVRFGDTGQGIPPERLPRIFDPFFTTKEKGLGMGMAIAHRVIEDHKGTVDVESAVGSGTTFVVYFPIHAGI
jgi:two-component system sensor histidine kinase AtoS